MNNIEFTFIVDILVALLYVVVQLDVHDDVVDLLVL